MTVLLSRDGAVARLLLNRPEKLNALNPAMREELIEHLGAIRHDSGVRAVVVAGAGRGFCSGADVGAMTGKHDLLRSRQVMQAHGHRYIQALHGLEKPTIAAVRGPAVGIGWSIVLACDLVVASASARFCSIFRQLGVAPDGGLTWFLARQLGPVRAKELVYTGRFVEAKEALALGLVNEVVPDDRLDARVAELAAELAEGPTFALALGKKLLHAALGPSLADFLEIESLVQPQLWATADGAEGVAAFKAKRRPSFVGR